MPKIITVQAKNGAREVPAVWTGRWLAVHRPLTADGLSSAPRTWTVSHLPSGYVAAKCLSTSKADAVAFAKAWDIPAAEWDSLTASASASKWPWRRRFLADRHAAAAGGPIFGPRSLSPLEQLQTAGTAADVSAAVAAAMGAPPPMDDAEASQQFPADLTRKTEGHGAIVRRDGVLSFCWMPKGENYSEAEALELWGWYPVPSAGDVERWCLGSLAETPAGDSVEPDHPDAWPRLLGLT